MPKVTKTKAYQLQRMQKCQEVLKRKRLALQAIDHNSLNNHSKQLADPVSKGTCKKLVTREKEIINIVPKEISEILTHEEVTLGRQDSTQLDENSRNVSDTSKDIKNHKVDLYKNIVTEETSESLTHEDPTLRCQGSDDKHEFLFSTSKKEETKEKHVGRRIVDVSHFSKQLLDLCNHGPLGCSASDIILTGEKQLGLISKFTFKCKMCNLNFIVSNDCCEENYLNLNACTVAGTITTGFGQSNLEELFSAMNLPILTQNIYDTNHHLISKHWEKVALNNTLEAGKREKEKAIAEGNVTKDGYGVIDVIVDGCWSKRSYKKNYSALSGAAAIIGKNTGEILFLGVKNKYCQVCAMAEKNKSEAKDHLCFKNYNGPSTGMESQILVEGFKNSIAQHSLVYGRLISDGDSSTYSKILEARPYNKTTVEKVECRNHVMRIFCNKLQLLATETKYLLKHRKCVTKKNIMTIRGSIIKTIRKHKTDSDVQLLFDDILRCHPHAFGDHSRCRNYFCEKVGIVDKDAVPNDFFSGALWQRINFLVQGVAAHARSLIHDVDSNRVENFHSVVAKFVGGKRINFSKKNSYQMRVYAAAVAFNAKKTISHLFKSINGGKSPTGKLKKFEEKRIKKNLYNRVTKKPRRRLFKASEKTDKDYGEGCTKPDMEEESFDKVKQIFIENLKKTDAEIERIQKNTILQSESGEWMELRRSLLTASNFGRIIKRRNETSCANIVKDLLYKANLNHVASIKHGRENERKALVQLSAQINTEIKQCGLFIDKKLPFLGATPDGLCDEDAVVEVKCPITAHKVGLKEAIDKKKVTFWKTNKKGEEEVNKTHNWFYQIQGQLHVTQRKRCIFAVWANEKEPLKIEIVERDDEFWRKTMEGKLKRFYMDCLLPELVDPRHPRNLKIRDPAYIQESIEKKKRKKETDKS